MGTRFKTILAVRFIWKVFHRSALDKFHFLFFMIMNPRDSKRQTDEDDRLAYKGWYRERVWNLWEKPYEISWYPLGVAYVRRGLNPSITLPPPCLWGGGGQVNTTLALISQSSDLCALFLLLFLTAHLEHIFYHNIYIFVFDLKKSKSSNRIFLCILFSAGTNTNME